MIYDGSGECDHASSFFQKTIIHKLIEYLDDCFIKGSFREKKADSKGQPRLLRIRFFHDFFIPYIFQNVLSVALFILSP
jgi:hypothetical protein